MTSPTTLGGSIRLPLTVPAACTLGAAGALLAACADDRPPDGGAASTSADVLVELRDTAFDPDEVTIAAGGSVEFRNVDDGAHQISPGTPGDLGDVGDRRLLEPELLVVRRFETPGTFPWVCTIHPDEMQLTITVTD